MPNNTDLAREALEMNSREAAIEQAWQGAESKFKSDPNYLLGAKRNPKQYLVHGFDAGIKWLTDGDDFKTAQAMLRGAIEEMQKPAAREAAWNQSPTYYRICDGNEPDPCRAEADWKSGYDAGAAREEWVAVSERLPHKTGVYDCTTREPQTDGTAITEVGVLEFSLEHKQWFDRWDTAYEYPLDIVIAWKERPKPYGGKDAR